MSKSSKPDNKTDQNAAEPKPSEHQPDFTVKEVLKDDLAQCEAKCRKCGEQRKIAWTPGLPCPVCGSKSFQPVVRVDHIEKTSTHHTLILTSKRMNVDFKGIDIKKYFLYGMGLILVFIWVKISWILLYDRIHRSPAADQYFVWEYTCTKCENRFTARPQVPPLNCPVCGSRAGYTNFLCMDCKRKFPLVDRFRSPVCPYCASSRILTYTPKGK